MTTQPIEADINAAARIIGDISTGIYRSPANALKELVSNSFDAGATEVLINTDHPAFSTVSCFDNGPGISAGDLQTIFGYIGGSDKRVMGETGPFQRPVIGRIGIGILAMSQISKRFVIISSQKGTPFRIEAEVDIEEFESVEAARTNLGSGTIGRYKIYHIPEQPEEHYTIVATPAGSAMLRKYLGSGQSVREQFVRQEFGSDDFREFVKRVSNEKQRPILNEYDTFLWELASLCPVPYFEDGPVRGWDGWNHIKRRLESFNFKVIVDGYELRKPILLPTAEDLLDGDEDSKVYPFTHDVDKEMGLKFEGYMFHQRKQIVPSELQGVLLRVRNVGITGYESDLLDYPRNLGPMRAAMTGEIYVDKGLEEALNIDRNSFNETHEHFIRVRDVLFEHLGLPQRRGITTDIRERSRARQEVLQQDRTIEDLERLNRRMNRAVPGEWHFELDADVDSPLSLDVQDCLVKINVSHDTVPKTRAARQEFFRVCLIARLAEALGAPAAGQDPIVGWLRRL